MDAQTGKITRKKDRTVVTINGPMTIANALELRECLLDAFAGGSGVEVSLAGMTDIDVAGLQLLCSAHKTALSRGVAFSITGGTEALSSVAKTAGMYRHKGCVEDAEGTCIWLKAGD